MEEKAEPAQKTPEDFEAMRKSVMAKKSIENITDADLPSFVGYMNQYKTDCLEKEDYLGAKDAAAILEACKAESATRQTKTQNETQNEQNMSNLSKKKAEIEAKIQRFDETTTEQQKAIQENQNKEITAFENKWRDEMPEKYRRVSKQLVELRETARTLALAGHYDEAAARKNEADQLEIEEHKEAQNKLRHDYRIAKNKMLQKHRTDLNKFTEARLQKRDLFTTEIRAIEENEKNRETVLKSKPQASRKTGVRDSQGDAHQNLLARSMPRKPHPIGENKLPPLKPPNEKETTPAANSTSGKSTETKKESPTKTASKIEEKSPTPKTKETKEESETKETEGEKAPEAEN